MFSKHFSCGFTSGCFGADLYYCRLNCHGVCSKPLETVSFFSSKMSVSWCHCANLVVFLLRGKWLNKKKVTGRELDNSLFWVMIHMRSILCDFYALLYLLFNFYYKGKMTIPHLHLVAYLSIILFMHTFSNIFSILNSRDTKMKESIWAVAWKPLLIEFRLYSSY